MTPPPPDAPRVSVVIPTYNGAPLLDRTIESVLAQTYTDWELVVSDDGSTDATIALAEGFAAADPRIRVHPAPNGGVAAARNRGLAATDAGSEFVIFLDHDDRWLPDALATMVGVLDARPDLASVYGLACCIGGDDRRVPGDDLEHRMRERFEFRGRHVAAVSPDEPTTFAAMMYHNFPVTPGLHLVRREVVEQVGPFDAEAVPADDWDMNIRITRVGPIGFCEQLVLEWRRHDGAQSALSSGWRRAHYHVRSKAYRAPDNSPEQTRLARTAYVSTFRSALRSSGTSLRERDATTTARNLFEAAEVAVRFASAEVGRRRDRRSSTGDGRRQR